MSHDLIAQNSLLIAISNKNMFGKHYINAYFSQSNQFSKNKIKSYSKLFSKIYHMAEKQKGCEQVHFIIIFPIQKQLHQKTTTNIHSLMTKVHM